MIYIPSIFNAKKDFDLFIKGFEMEWPEYFSEYSRFYNIATESIKDYMPCIDNNISSALTVGASADQGIALTNKGAKDVYFFDINKADYYFIMLKKYAIMYLKRKDFLDFLIAESGQTIMNYRLYSLFSDKLPKQVKLFWDNVYSYFNNNNEAMSYYLFRSPKKHSKMSRTINDYYIKNEIYYNTRNNLEKCNWYFIQSDFYELDKNLPENINYDAIILSNIYEYLNFGEEVTTENAKKYVLFIKNVLLPKLKNNGTIMSAYLCRYDDKVDSKIEQSIKLSPNEWARSTNFLSGLDNLDKYLTGYTGQNVSYHYLLNELNNEIPHQKIITSHSGYGMSSATTDMALIYKKK